MEYETKKARKGAFLLIIILLIIFLPLSVISVLLRKTITNKIDTPQNVNHELLYDNKMWFYDSDDKFLASYECHSSDCDYANLDMDKKTSLFNNRFAFITDEIKNMKVVFLYDALNKVSYESIPYKRIVSIMDNYVILENLNGYYGVISLSSTPKTVIDFNYNYISLHNEKLIAKQNDKWYLITLNNEILTNPIEEEIIDFNDFYLIVSNQNGLYNLVDYNGLDKLNGDCQKLNFVGKKLEVQINDTYYIYDYENDLIVSEVYNVLNNQNYEAKLTEDGLIEIYADNQFLNSLIN